MSSADAETIYERVAKIEDEIAALRNCSISVNYSILVTKLELKYRLFFRFYTCFGCPKIF